MLRGYRLFAADVLIGRIFRSRLPPVENTCTLVRSTGSSHTLFGRRLVSSSAASESNPVVISAPKLAQCLHVGTVLKAAEEHRERHGELELESLLLVASRLRQLKGLLVPEKWEQSAKELHASLGSVISSLLLQCNDLAALHRLVVVCNDLELLSDDCDEKLLASATDIFTRVCLTSNATERPSDHVQTRALVWPVSLVQAACQTVDLASLDQQSLLLLMNAVAAVKLDLNADTLEAVLDVVRNRELDTTDRLLWVEMLCRLGLASDGKVHVDAFVADSTEVTGQVIAAVGKLLPTSDSSVCGTVKQIIGLKASANLSPADKILLSTYRSECGLSSLPVVRNVLHVNCMEVLDNPAITEKDAEAVVRFLLGDHPRAYRYLVTSQLISKSLVTLLTSERSQDFSDRTKARLFIATVVSQGGRRASQKLHPVLLDQLMPVFRDSLSSLDKHELVLVIHRMLPALAATKNVSSERWLCQRAAEKVLCELDLQQVTWTLFGLLSTEANISGSDLAAFLKQASRGILNSTTFDDMRALCTLIDVLGWVRAKADNMKSIVAFLQDVQEPLRHFIPLGMEQRASKEISIMNQGLRNLLYLDAGAITPMLKVLPPPQQHDNLHELVNTYGVFSVFGIFNQGIRFVYDVMRADPVAFSQQSCEDQVSLAYDAVLFRLVPEQWLAKMFSRITFIHLLKSPGLVHRKYVYLSRYAKVFHPDIPHNEQALLLLMAMAESKNKDILRVSTFHGWLSHIGPVKYINAVRSLFPDRSILSQVEVHSGLKELACVVLRPDTLDCVPWDHPEVAEHLRASIATNSDVVLSKLSPCDIVNDGKTVVFTPRTPVGKALLQARFLESKGITQVAKDVITVDATALRQRGLRPMVLALVPEHSTCSNIKLAVNSALLEINLMRLLDWEVAPVFSRDVVSGTEKHMAAVVKRRFETALRLETSRKCWEFDESILLDEVESTPLTAVSAAVSEEAE